MANDEITVLLVDDSKLVRRGLRELFERDVKFHIVGEASTGKQAVGMARELDPCLITMDLDMPEMNGLDAIEEIMADSPTRILVVTGNPRYGGLDASFEALSRGALELIPKPSAWPGTGLEQARLLRCATELASVPVLPHVKALSDKRRQAKQDLHSEIPTFPNVSLAVIGASTGGPSVLRAILQALPRDFCLPIVIVQHLPDVFTTGFIEWLASYSKLPVREAMPGDRLEPGVVYVSVRGPHLVVSPRNKLEVSKEPPRGNHCPSVDVLFESAARAYGSGTLAMLLTGMGKDGARGLKVIANAGGCTIAQDEVSCVVFGMPQEAIQLGAAQHVLATADLPRILIEASWRHAAVQQIERRES